MSDIPTRDADKLTDAEIDYVIDGRGARSNSQGFDMIPAPPPSTPNGLV